MGSHNLDVNGHAPQLQFIDLSFDTEKAEESACSLVYRIQPKWRDAPGKIEIVKFTEGITNNVRPIFPGLLGVQVKHVLTYMFGHSF
jgi:hypothetical protein